MTPAIELLKRLGIDHVIEAYDHDPAHESYGMEAAEALEVDPDAVFKTLMVTLDDDRVVIGVVPVRCQLDLKALAIAAGAKKARMTDPSEAERRSGYVVGGISPFGQRRDHSTFVDLSAERWRLIHCSAGRRGLEVGVAPEVFPQVLGATFAQIAVWPTGD